MLPFCSIHVLQHNIFWCTFYCKCQFSFQICTNQITPMKSIEFYCYRTMSSTPGLLNLQVLTVNWWTTCLFLGVLSYPLVSRKTVSIWIPTYEHTKLGLRACSQQFLHALYSNHLLTARDCTEVTYFCISTEHLIWGNDHFCAEVIETVINTTNLSLC